MGGKARRVSDERKGCHIGGGGGRGVVHVLTNHGLRHISLAGKGTIRRVVEGVEGHHRQVLSYL